MVKINEHAPDGQECGPFDWCEERRRIECIWCDRPFTPRPTDRPFTPRLTD